MVNYIQSEHVVNRSIYFSRLFRAFSFRFSATKMMINHYTCYNFTQCGDCCFIQNLSFRRHIPSLTGRVKQFPFVYFREARNESTSYIYTKHDNMILTYRAKRKFYKMLT